MKNTVVLVVLDGWGIGAEGDSNPIYVAKPKNIEYIKNNFPSGALQASGIAVGLPWGEEGNSEVGHLTMGAGKVIYQHYPRISLSIRDGSFFNNPTINQVFDHAYKNNSKVNLIGLVGEANVHSSMEHLEALIELANKKQVNYKIHVITDGRDSAPKSALELIERLPQDKIASIMGRFYAMDRDRRWDLTQRAYQALIGEAPIIKLEEIKDHLQKTYEKNLNDEFIVPAIINSQENAIKDNDAIFFFNFREDRMRQLAEGFVNPSFSQFPVKHFNNLFIASMTQLRDDFSIPVAFPPQHVDNPVGKIIADHQKSQLRIAETQKYAHVTFFFNGLSDKAFLNEYRILIPSRIIPRQDQDPVMMAPEITTRLLQAIEEEAFDFILVNYANGDMVAHTGNFEASLKAVNVIDEQIGKITQAVLKHNATAIITSDHGNIERLFNPITGEPETKHDASPVPIYLVSNRYKKPQNPFDVRERERIIIGMLADIAPTILELMELPKHPDMTGQSLIRHLVNQ
jgi:2,3-bisphosphoglycerate-independent phosphoglycerate mutase